MKTATIVFWVFAKPVFHQAESFLAVVEVEQSGTGLRRRWLQNDGYTGGANTGIENLTKGKEGIKLKFAVACFEWAKRSDYQSSGLEYLGLRNECCELWEQHTEKMPRSLGRGRSGD